MLRIRILSAVLVAAGAVACQERLTAPGRCPELCPPEELEIVDTLLTGVVSSDTSFRGYVFPHESPIMVASSMDSFVSVAVVRFEQRPERWFPTSDTAGVRIGTVDSVLLDFRLQGRDTAAKNLRLLVYRVPRSVDTTATLDSIGAWLADSLVVDSAVIHDDTVTANVTVRLPPARMEPDSVDSGVVAIAIGVRADRGTAVTLLSSQSSVLPRLRYFVRGQAPQDTMRTTFNLAPRFDTFLGSPAPAAPGAGALVVGNLPAARALLRFSLPGYLVDSTTVLRASLSLRLTRPVTGRPREAFAVTAIPVLRDYGGKSILIPDTTTQGRGTVSVGDTGTVVIEMSRVLRFWRGVNSDTIPRVIVLRAAAEDATLGEMQVARGSAGAAAPTLRVTFARPYRFGVP